MPSAYRTDATETIAQTPPGRRATVLRSGGMPVRRPRLICFGACRCGGSQDGIRGGGQWPRGIWAPPQERRNKKGRDAVRASAAAVRKSSSRACDGGVVCETSGVELVLRTGVGLTQAHAKGLAPPTEDFARGWFRLLRPRRLWPTAWLYRLAPTAAHTLLSAFTPAVLPALPAKGRARSSRRLAACSGQLPAGRGRWNYRPASARSSIARLGRAVAARWNDHPRGSRNSIARLGRPAAGIIVQPAPATEI